MGCRKDEGQSPLDDGGPSEDPSHKMILLVCADTPTLSPYLFEPRSLQVGHTGPEERDCGGPTGYQVELGL